MAHDSLRGVLFVEGLESSSGSREAVLGFPLGIGQLAATSFDVLGLVISHVPTLRPERARSPEVPTQLHPRGSAISYATSS